ncbi:PREDICTED: uncharacterized protein LOC105455555 isoform X3 [Wasmannia auropunctata]|uniref:uncharacterized protein LOC105455555 isoform X3 n=1 Tax=Wasmannia auropunctata TaxID=64793 RepID=UPI0005EFF3CC|nr:PREDICTED: uncharacterized protein LOC105455555 isoform X3 [Wasmannia auropunctata]
MRREIPAGAIRCTETATDAVGMRVQSVAKIDGLTKRGSSGIGKRFQEASQSELIET